ncbi:MAG: hypothetical protein AAFR47_05600 [Pseudomonadota bacterium]
MIRLVLAVILLATPAVAQDPILRVEIEETEAIPGQPLSLRLTVIVPTFLPDPPVWPNYEAPNLLVRVGSTGPVSDRVDGATWAGVSRRYLITPMVPGGVDLPAQEVTVTWADPDTNDPRQVALPTEALTVTGIVPEGAEGLDPFIAADVLTLDQDLTGEPEGMQPGDSVTRTVTATVRGTSPRFVPPLLTASTIAGVRAYPEEPVLEETAERGIVQGSRSETVTYVAEGGGSGEAPAVTLDWYNLGTGAVETAGLPSLSLSVDGPPAQLAPSVEPRDWRALAVVTIAAVLALTLVVLSVRRLAPPLRAYAVERRTAWQASEGYAWVALQQSLRTRDAARLRPALDLWAARLPGPDPLCDPRVSDALTTLGAARYGPAEGQASDGWRRLAKVLPDVRRTARRHARPDPLPPLNPGS